MRVLDLFCGAGGAGTGYHRAGFDVVGVDIRLQLHYPFEFHQADALEYCQQHGREYDLIHASPPCQLFSVITPERKRTDHTDLIRPVQILLRRLGVPYVIENVSGARGRLNSPVLLCGSMFGLRVFRHRFFECAFSFLTPSCRHDFVPIYITGTGRGGKDARLHEKRAASGIDWMNTKELDQAIPPAFTEYIGKQFLRSIRHAI